MRSDYFKSRQADPGYRFAVAVHSRGRMVGPVGFEPTTSAESFVYGYLHALLNFVIPPTGGLLTRCNIFWSPSSFLSRTHLLEWVWLDYGPSTDLKARGPTELPARKLSVYS